VISRDTFLNLFDYNYWARDRQLQVCAALNEDQFRRQMGSSFSSVQATLAHMVETEWVWSERWYGRSPTTQDAQEFAPERLPSLIKLQERWHSVERSVRSYLTDLKEDRLTKELRYVNRKGESLAYPLWQALFHLINHQTYHRGQVTTMLRQLGGTPAQIDYLVAYDLGLRGK
jgi:uncharacterized damage-inducible protein DinB